MLKTIFTVSRHEGHLTIHAKSYQDKVRRWLGFNSRLYSRIFDQAVISVYNKYTSEETMFNPLRARRPIADPDVPELE